MTDDRKELEEVPEPAALPREAAPPPGLEERVIRALRRQGLLAEPTRKPWRQSLVLAGATAAALAIFFAGYLLGTARRPAAGPDFQPTFALLLRSGPSYQETANEEEERERVEEYGAWARGLYQSGVGIRGEKLGDDGRLLRAEAEATLSPAAGAAETEPLSGFFLINAPTLDDALRIARSCPHLRHGGTIEVRPMVPT